MNVYDSLDDLYNTDSEENEIILQKAIKGIQSIQYNGHETTVKGETYFIHHILDVNGQKVTMGNKWKVYNISKNKYIVSGVTTKKEAIQLLKLI